MKVAAVTVVTLLSVLCQVSKQCVPLFIGLTVLAIGISFGYNCGYAINPARDLAPRLFTGELLVLVPVRRLSLLSGSPVWLGRQRVHLPLHLVVSGARPRHPHGGSPRGLALLSRY